jgi:hypothetical protein
LSMWCSSLEARCSGSPISLLFIHGSICCFFRATVPFICRVVHFGYQSVITGNWVGGYFLNCLTFAQLRFTALPPVSAWVHSDDLMVSAWSSSSYLQHARVFARVHLVIVPYSNHSLPSSVEFFECELIDQFPFRCKPSQLFHSRSLLG